MKRIIALTIAVVMLFALAGCGGNTEVPANGNASTVNGNGATQGTGENNGGGNGEPVAKTKTDEAAFGFAFNIFKELSSEDKGENVFISPLSISTALSVIYNGAASTTKEAMAKVLGYEGLDTATVNKDFSELLKRLDNKDEKVTLNISNSVWLRAGEKVNEGFMQTGRESFGAEVRELDFALPNSADTINGWISKATEGMIEKMIEPPINRDTLMFIINAIYFKGEWNTKFETKNSVDGIFKSYGNGGQTTTMMNRTGTIEHYKGEGFTAVKLPYGKGGTAMYALLPDAGKDINEFVSELSKESWAAMTSAMTEVEDLVLQLPRFKSEYGIKELNKSLSALGMGEAFGETADLSGIRDDAFISKVSHKAVIEVNEEGSEAAAVTVGEIRGTSAREPVTFIADRPFVYAIVDEATGTILFMGKLLNIES